MGGELGGVRGQRGRGGELAGGVRGRGRAGGGAGGGGESQGEASGGAGAGESGGAKPARRPEPDSRLRRARVAG